MSIREQAEQFAMDIMGTFAEVLPRGNLGMELSVAPEQDHYTLSAAEPNGIELQVDGKTVMRFEIDYRLSPDRSGRWLKVRRSTFALVPEAQGTPFFRYDFQTDLVKVPKAHINIHAHRDDLIAALVGSNRGHIAKKRRKAFVEHGSLPRVSNFHFPVGGTRFRPCWEDVLEAAIKEFGLDRQPGYEAVLEEGKARFRGRQLRASVRDFPEQAVEVLEALGYTVTAPETL